MLGIPFLMRATFFAKDLDPMDTVNIFEQFCKKESFQKDIVDKNALILIEQLIKTHFQITSAISGQENLNKILELIVRKAPACLKAHRCTLFLVSEKNEEPLTQISFTPDEYAEKPLPEEMALIQKLAQKDHPFLMRTPEDFPEVHELGWNGAEITSLMCIPLILQGKRVGAFIAVLTNEAGYRFDEKSLQLFSSFANLAIIAMKNASLFANWKKEKTFRMTYERYLNATLYDLQIECHKEGKIQNFDCHGGQTKHEPFGQIQETSGASKKPRMELRKDERIETILQVEFENEDKAFTKNLSKGGTSIQTNNPKELGDQFQLKIHLLDGRKPIEVECRVIWTNKYVVRENLRKGMGVKFLNMQPEEQKRIEEYIQSRKAENL
jgi:uncharacterized protein (TIGR02266 family)